MKLGLPIAGPCLGPARLFVSRTARVRGSRPAVGPGPDDFRLVAVVVVPGFDMLDFVACAVSLGNQIADVQDGMPPAPGAPDIQQPSFELPHRRRRDWQGAIG